MLLLLTMRCACARQCDRRACFSVLAVLLNLRRQPTMSSTQPSGRPGLAWLGHTTTTSERQLEGICHGGHRHEIENALCVCQRQGNPLKWIKLSLTNVL